MEIPLADATKLFIGKTIAKMDATCCNNVEFLFTDGSRVALHIEVEQSGLPFVAACTDCAEIS